MRLLNAADNETRAILAVCESRRSAYQRDAHTPSHTKTGGEITSRYPLLTNLRKINTKNTRPGAIQTQVKIFFRRSAPGAMPELARPSRKVKSAAQPKQRMWIPTMEKSL